MIVGGQEMDWDDYWAMIKEMEKAQIPFKNWIEKDLLPKYQIFLSQKYQKYTLNKHLEVADHFFHRVLHVGFITLEEIRKDFIQKEFPRWWQTHVLTDSLSEKEKKLLIEISPRTIDRLLKRLKSKYKKFGLSTTKPGSLLKKQVPIKLNQWDERKPGFIEADTVAPMHQAGAWP